jgi:hypothetical protein
MSKLLMMAGAIATGGEPATDHVSAYVVLSDGGKSRMFRVFGTLSAPQIEELDGGTTLDLRRFQEKLKRDLVGLGPHRPADAHWACDAIRVHLRCDLGM